MNVYGGAYSFRGGGSASAANGYLNPSGMYGRKPQKFSYAIEWRGQMVTARRRVFGMALGFEKLLSYSRTIVFQTDIIDGMPLIPPQNGTTKLAQSAIDLHPFIGQRFIFHAVSLDVLAGLDIAYCLPPRIAIQVADYTHYYKFERNDITPAVDFRPRLQVNATYKNISLLAGYSLGITNFQEKMNAKAYSGLFRLGVGYWLK